MSLLTLIIAICVVGVVLWAINKFVPMEANVKSILNVAVILILVVYLLEATGLLRSISAIHV